MRPERFELPLIKPSDIPSYCVEISELGRFLPKPTNPEVKTISKSSLEYELRESLSVLQVY